jgi:hypothetical protein
MQPVPITTNMSSNPAQVRCTWYKIMICVNNQSNYQVIIDSVYVSKKSHSSVLQIDFEIFRTTASFIKISSWHSLILVHYGCWIYYYLCSQCLSPLTWVRILHRWGVLDTKLCDKVCQWLATGSVVVIVSVIASNEVHRGSNPSEVKLKTIKLVFGASLLRVQEWELDSG